MAPEMIIHTERLTLEPLTERFLRSTHVYASDRETTRLMMFLPVEDIAETERYLVKCRREMEKPEPVFYELAILLNGTHIGGVSAYAEENGSVWELGWILDKRYHGHGYAPEAARGLMERLNSMRPLPFIAHCDSENHASRRVMEKLGFRLAGISGGRKNRSSPELREECLYIRPLDVNE